MKIRIEEYKGFEITMQELDYSGAVKFEGTSKEDGFSIIGSRPCDIRDKIDKRVKKNFKRIKALVVGQDGPAGCFKSYEIEITSIASKDEYWITYLDDGRRSKIGSHISLVKDTPENREKIIRILETTGTINDLVVQNTAARKALAPVSNDEIFNQ
ncbi:MAG TPA: hypothetical protein DCZ94_21650 [Lentisphaeria bacterium]|nr:MAG: hypothetical protein A2X48_14580 [Lentisphaerae bacterium GWF2_49_21]HBC89551.1 hypothetical protein [Lentisphaeria bacterium]